MPSVIRRVSDIRTLVADWRGARRVVGFVPTMGALHEGHISLVRHALEVCDKVVVSVFVNPLQFDRKDDFESYPSTEEEDVRLLMDLGVHGIYLPRHRDLFSAGFSTRVSQTSLTDQLCGASRPGHFEGVLTIVCKLFNIVMPDRAFFGRKDLQQGRIIQKMTRDLNFPIEIVLLPTVRESDGLALSSRNRLLTPAHREAAVGISAAIGLAQAAVADAPQDASDLASETADYLACLDGAEVDYCQICEPDGLEPREGQVLSGDVIAVAVFFGAVRLIDNADLLGSS